MFSNMCRVLLVYGGKNTHVATKSVDVFNVKLIRNWMYNLENEVSLLTQGCRLIHDKACAYFCQNAVLLTTFDHILYSLDFKPS